MALSSTEGDFDDVVRMVRAGDQAETKPEGPLPLPLLLEIPPL